MQTEGEEASSPMMDPWSIFLYGMKAPMTREKYRGRLAKFFDFIAEKEKVIVLGYNSGKSRTTSFVDLVGNCRY